MNRLLTNRGPDDQGIWINDAMTQGMGMTRLAIVDADFAKQPWQEKHIRLCFNGEIYNFKALRQTLKKEGYHFFTASDTEVLAKAYLHWGTKSFEYLEGMFAISILDYRLQKLILVRDINGEKPLYYFINHKGLAWSSELKGLLISFQYLSERSKAISFESLDCYLRLGFIPAPRSIYDSILKLMPAQFLSIDLGTLEVEKNTYWTLPNYSAQLDKPTAIKHIDVAIKESLQQQISVNHNSGLLLSGGIDSSILAYWLKEIKPSTQCFSVQVNPRNASDESFAAQKIAKYLGLKHEIVPLPESLSHKELYNLLYYFDEPFADSSAIASNRVFQHVKSEFKIMFGGDGADEIFGGYKRYLMPIKAEKIRNIVKSLACLKHMPFHKLPDVEVVNLWFKLIDRLGNNTLEDIWNISQMGISRAILQKILLPHTQYPYDQLKERFSKLDPIDSITLARIWDKEIALEGDMLVKTDRMSMRQSIEYRTPFLFKKFWEIAQQIPSDLLIHKGTTKYILKEYHAQLFPQYLRQGSKKGFEVPIATWLNSSLKSELLMLTSKSFLKQQSIFQPDEMERLVRFYIQKPHRYKFQLWIIYCFQNWYKHHF